MYLTKETLAKKGRRETGTGKGGGRWAKLPHWHAFQHLLRQHELLQEVVPDIGMQKADPTPLRTKQKEITMRIKEANNHRAA